MDFDLRNNPVDEAPKQFVEHLHDLESTPTAAAMRPKTGIAEAMLNLIEVLKASKPNNRSERDRHYAIAITDAEKLWGYIHEYLWE